MSLRKYGARICDGGPATEYDALVAERDDLARQLEEAREERAELVRLLRGTALPVGVDTGAIHSRAMAIRILEFLGEGDDGG